MKSKLIWRFVWNGDYMRTRINGKFMRRRKLYVLKRGLAEVTM